MQCRKFVTWLVQVQVQSAGPSGWAQAGALLRLIQVSELGSSASGTALRAGALLVHSIVLVHSS